MPNQIQMTNVKIKYDLEERTVKFGEEIIKFAKKITENSITKPLISQLVRSGHWLRVIVIAIPELREEARKLWQEAKELNLIFNAIIHSSKK